MPEGGVAHYVGSGQIARADHAECDAQVAGIVAYHERNGYKAGGAYNEHVCQHGGRWLHYLGPNQASGQTWANLNLHAVCAVIGDGDTPTLELLAAMRAAWDDAAAGQWVTPHSYWFNTSCCGDPLREWIAAGAVPPTPAPTLEDEDMGILVADSTGAWWVVHASGWKYRVFTQDVPLLAISGLIQNQAPHDWSSLALGDVLTRFKDVMTPAVVIGGQPGGITVAQVEAIVVGTLNRTTLGVG